MSAKRSVKARKMWGVVESVQHDESFTLSHKKEWPYIDIAMLVLPADAASYEAMVEQVAKALNKRASGPEFGPFFMDVDRKHARDLLSSIGITRPAKTRK